MDKEDKEEITNQVDQLQGQQIIDNARKTAEKFLDTVVNTILIRQRKNKNSIAEKKNKKYPQLYTNIKEMLSQFDTSIVQCKQYNEARIHRKYEIQIQDLKQQIKILNDKIRQQKKARSPSKKYVQQLVDQLVIYKDQNCTLRSQVQLLDKKNQEIRKTIEYLQGGGESPVLSHSQIKSKQYMTDHSIQSMKQQQDNPQNQNVLPERVNEFLKLKHSERKIRGGKKSKFQLFLKRSREHIIFWNLNDLLEGIDDWTKQLQNSYDHEKLKSNIYSSLGDSQTFRDNKKLPMVYRPHNKNLGIAEINFQNKYKTDNNRDRNRKYHSTIEVAQRGAKYKIM